MVIFTPLNNRLVTTSPRLWSNWLVTVEMKLDEFRPGIESLSRTYSDVADILDLEDRAVRQHFYDVLSSWHRALSPDYEFLAKYEESVLRDRASIEKHNQNVGQLDDVVRQRDYENIPTWSAYLLNTLRRYVTKVEDAAKRHAGRLEGEGEASEALKAREDYRAAGLLLREMEQTELSHALRLAVKKANAAVEEAETAAESARAAAGIASGSTLTQRFEALSNEQLRTAKIFRWLTVIGVFLGIFLTYWMAFPFGEFDAIELSAGDAILRVSLLGAVLGLATYFGRQAGYHRDLGIWAKTIKEQLLTFDGYMEPLHDEQLRDAMRVSFAARVFGPTPEYREDSGVTLSSSMASGLLEMVGKSQNNAK